MVSKIRGRGQPSLWLPKEYLCITPVHVWAVFTKTNLFLVLIYYFCLVCCWSLDTENSLFCSVWFSISVPSYQLYFLLCLLSGVFCNDLSSSHVLRKPSRHITHLISCLLTTSQSSSFLHSMCFSWHETIFFVGWSNFLIMLSLPVSHPLLSCLHLFFLSSFCCQGTKPKALLYQHGCILAVDVKRQNMEGWERYYLPVAMI